MKSAVSTSDTLGLMLRDLDQFPMPDHEQQVELAKRVALRFAARRTASWDHRKLAGTY